MTQERLAARVVNVHNPCTIDHHDVVNRDGRVLASLAGVGDVRLLGKGACAIAYGSLEESPTGWAGAASCPVGELDVRVEDHWSSADIGLDLERVVTVPPSPKGSAIHVRTALRLAAREDQIRSFVPGNVYDRPANDVVSFSDGRVSYPLTGVWDETQKEILVLLRTDLATNDADCERTTGQTEYAHATDIGSVGLALGSEGVELLTDFPYWEGPGSSFLDSAGTPALAFFPVPAAGTAIRLRYRFGALPAADFPAAVWAAFGLAAAANQPEPVQLPFTLAEACELRRESATHTYVEWSDRGAGFILNFDPELGYASPPRAFGASFTEHRMDRARDIVEFGFTGRQLNVAYELAEFGGPEWEQRRRRVCDFFVRELVTADGFCFSHYDIGGRRPVYSVGDPSGPVLHYLVSAERSGTYLRLTSEAATDLLLNARSASARGAHVSEWWDALRRMARFLLRCQRADGTWLRAHTPEGEGISGGPWLGDGELATTATAAPVPFLLELAADLPELAGDLVASAERAGAYVIQHQIAPARYRGGTLDNPNVVDKESALIAMAAMVALHRHTGRAEYLAAAVSAGRIGMSWTVLWDVPTVPGTRVHAAGVRSTGWGGINSIWGTGVTDVYSLFYLQDLLYLAERADDPLIEQIVDLTAKGTAQLLAYPGNRFGMAGDGMQPEGISHCGQGLDEDLIRKGDTWGGLGWIYTAGTFGLRPALRLDHEPSALLTAPENHR